ncbi:MAG: TlpA family protein disulfide reductase [Lachnospiraceae bacterium]|nr:TlpA family protein disulfide reductase [Lachnospiraceae bacterium]
MLKKILKVLTIVFAAYGVLFIILLLLPEDEEDSTAQTVTEESVEAASEEEKEQEENVSQGPKDEDTEGEAAKEESQETTEAASETAVAEAEEETVQNDQEEAQEETVQNGQEEAATDGESGKEEGKHTVKVNIPESELGGETFKFRSTTLDNKVVTDEIFKDYDLTIVHVWGTYCGPCIAEMGDYAELYKDLPDNVNLVGLVCDVYDGLDNNVDTAHEILDDAGAKFTNIATSDSNYDLVFAFQYVPSSFFVDREGRIVGKLMDGAKFKDTKKRLNSYLE